jgi:hypothetical protein
MFRITVKPLELGVLLPPPGGDAMTIRPTTGGRGPATAAPTGHRASTSRSDANARRTTGSGSRGSLPTSTDTGRPITWTTHVRLAIAQDRRELVVR